MRDIIFRGKRVDYNDWVYGNRIHDDVINRDCYLGRYAVLPETIGQFTGICDTKGNKIFEGDIVESPHGTRGVVEWHRATCAFLVNIGDDWQTMDECPYKVISNIYDNEIKNCDYVVNAGVSWDNLAPLYTSSSKEAAIDTARHLTIECVEVVYSPCDNWNVDEVVWSNRKKDEIHFQKYETKPEE